MAEMTGGCLCGGVRYTVTGGPAFQGLCHCRNCQRYTGTGFETFIVFPIEAVSVQGELKTYEHIGGSGQQVYRRFCPNCGSGVINDADVLVGMRTVLAGTLDDPTLFKPTMDAFWSCAQLWVQTGGERTKFPGMPT
jgi:hypothetical protein